MKHLAILISLIFSTALIAEINVEKAGTNTDGFCVMKTMNLYSSTNIVTKITDTEERNFFKNAKERAQKLYKEYMGDYVEKGSKLTAKGKAVRYGDFGNQFDNDSFGAIVDVELNGNDDQMTFYFNKGYDAPEAELLMAFHNDVEPLSFWVCEYEK